MKISKDVKKKFFDKVEIPENRTGCWLWKGSIGGCRYGGFRFNGTSELAHRMSWMIHYGEIPKGLYVCHHCDNPKCVNPVHLFVGSQSDNMSDMVRKGRGRGSGLFGQNVGTSKLTNESVKEIKKLIKEKVRGIDIAKIYNIHKATISDIKIGKTWKHVTI